MRGKSAGALGALVLIANAGCVSLLLDPMGSRSALADSQRRYTQHIRWGEIDRASEFVDPVYRDEFLSHAPAFENIRVTDYEIGDIAYGEDSDSATVTVSYRAYSLATMVERPFQEKQAWHREGARTWWVRPEIEGVLKDFQ